MTKEEALLLIKKSHPFYWKGYTQTFFDENGEQVFQVWSKKTGERLFRITEKEFNNAFEVLYNEQT